MDEKRLGPFGPHQIRIHAQFKRLSNMRVSTLKGGHGLQFRFPGFSYDDFDQTGNLNIVRLNKMLESNRFVDGHGLTLDPSDSFLYVILGSHLTCSLDIYRRACVVFPMIYNSGPVRLGSSSIDVGQTLCEDTGSDTADVLVYRVARGIAIDRESFRPVRIPDNVRGILSDAVASWQTKPKGELPRLDIPGDAPVGSFSYGFVPHHDDMDLMFHVNQSAYLGFVMECAARALLVGAYPHFCGDSRNRYVRSVTELHSAEAFAGDRLIMWTWEDPEDECALFFVVKKDGDVVYRARVVYYSAEEGSDI